MKNIQKGIGTIAANTSTDVAITITSVNPDKCIVLLTPNSKTTTGGGVCYASLKTLSSSTLTVTTSSSLNTAGEFSWQIIEYT